MEVGLGHFVTMRHPEIPWEGVGTPISKHLINTLCFVLLFETRSHVAQADLKHTSLGWP